MSTQLTSFVVDLREAIRAVIPSLVDLLKDGDGVFDRRQFLELLSSLKMVSLTIL